MYCTWVNHDTAHFEVHICHCVSVKETRCQCTFSFISCELVHGSYITARFLQSCTKYFTKSDSKYILSSQWLLRQRKTVFIWSVHSPIFVPDRKKTHQHSQGNQQDLPQILVQIRICHSCSSATDQYILSAKKFSRFLQPHSVCAGTPVSWGVMLP